MTFPAWPAILVVRVTLIVALPRFFRIAAPFLLMRSMILRVVPPGTFVLPRPTTISFGFFLPCGLARAALATGRKRIPAADAPFIFPSVETAQLGAPQ